MSELGFIGRSAALIVSVALLLLGPVPAAAAGSGHLPATQQPGPALRPAQIVVLVDESGSLSDDDIARERDAAGVIVRGEPSPESTISVVGFASADQDGQSPVDLVCPPMKLNPPQNRQVLLECIGKLRERGPAEGNGTDYVSALRQALDYLSGLDLAGQPKIVFLLTDGELDVHNSPKYGGSNAAAEQQIPGLLDELNRAGVQVWPLGFGDADQAELDRLATGAAQDGCGATTSPTATVIGGSDDLNRAIHTAYGAARCTVIEPTAVASQPVGVVAELSLDGVGADVVAGAALDGTANVTNATGQPRTLRLEVTDPSSGTVVTVEPERLTVPPSGQAVTLPFTVRFAPDTRLGSNDARLRLVDAADGALVSELLFARDVVAEPTFVDRIWRLWWLWLPLAVPPAGVVAAVLWWLRRRRGQYDVRGIRVELRRHGQAGQPPVRAHQRAQEFRFGVRRGESAADTSLTTGPGGDRYRVRRSPSGPTLWGPSGEPADLAPGGVLDLGDGLELVVHDRPAVLRSTGPGRRPPATGGRSDRPRPTHDPYDITS